MHEIFASNTLNFFTLFRPIMLISSRLKSPNSILLHLSGSLNAQLCNLISYSPGLAFFLLITHMHAAASSFLSDRVYPFLNSQSIFFGSPVLDFVGVNLLLKNFCCLSSLDIYAPRICSLSSKTDSFSAAVLSSSRNIYISGDFNYHHSWDVSQDLDPKYLLSLLTISLFPLFRPVFRLPSVSRKLVEMSLLL